MASGVKIADFKHKFGVDCVEFYQNWLLTSSHDQFVRIWDVNKSKLVRRLDHEPDPAKWRPGWCENFDISPNKLILAVNCKVPLDFMYAFF